MAEDRSAWTVEQWAAYAKELESRLPVLPVDAFKARKSYQIQRLDARVAELNALIAVYRDELANADVIVAQLEAAKRPAPGGMNVSIEVPSTVLDVKGN